MGWLNSARIELGVRRSGAGASHLAVFLRRVLLLSRGSFCSMLCNGLLDLENPERGQSQVFYCRVGMGSCLLSPSEGRSGKDSIFLGAALASSASIKKGRIHA